MNCESEPLKIYPPTLPVGCPDCETTGNWRSKRRRKRKEDSLIVTIRKSKTDQEGSGAKVGIPYGSNPATCPVRSLKAWLEVSRIESEALFRSVDRHGRLGRKRISDKAVSDVVKKYARLAGLEPASYSGHSLRRGFATQADLNRAGFMAIKKQGRWKSDAVVHGYMENSNLFDDNAAAQLGM